MRRLIVLVAFVSLVAAAPAGASVKNPCGLITAANATKALGVTVPASKPETLGLYQACSYASGGKRLTVLASIDHQAFVEWVGGVLVVWVTVARGWLAVGSVCEVQVGLRSVGAGPSASGDSRVVWRRGRWASGGGAVRLRVRRGV
jgi:hypothetical protein